MKSIINTIIHHRIVPVAAIENPNNAVPVAKALVRGGLPLIEVTFRTYGAEESIFRIKNVFLPKKPYLLVHLLLLHLGLMKKLLILL